MFNLSGTQNGTNRYFNFRKSNGKMFIKFGSSGGSDKQFRINYTGTDTDDQDDGFTVGETLPFPDDFVNGSIVTVDRVVPNPPSGNLIYYSPDHLLTTEKADRIKAGLNLEYHVWKEYLTLPVIEITVANSDLGGNLPEVGTYPAGTTFNITAGEGKTLVSFKVNDEEKLTEQSTSFLWEPIPGEYGIVSATQALVPVATHFRAKLYFANPMSAESDPGTLETIVWGAITPLVNNNVSATDWLLSSSLQTAYRADLYFCDSEGDNAIFKGKIEWSQPVDGAIAEYKPVSWVDGKVVQVGDTWAGYDSVSIAVPWIGTQLTIALKFGIKVFGIDQTAEDPSTTNTDPTEPQTPSSNADLILVLQEIRDQLVLMNQKLEVVPVVGDTKSISTLCAEILSAYADRV